MTGMVVFTVIDILLLIAGLAFYLFWVGSLLGRIATATTTTRPKMFAISQRECWIEDSATSCIFILPTGRGRAAVRR